MKAFLHKIKKWCAKAFNLSVLEKSRMPWVDYLKGIAIVLVVYRHALIGIERSGLAVPEYLVNANMIFFSFRMPLFFILSGIFISASLAKRTVNQLAFIKFETLLYPYFVWVFLQITLQILLARFTNSNRSFIDYLYIFYQPRELDQFWYLPALFNTTIIYVLVKTKLKPPAWLHIFIGIGFYFLSYYVQSISIISDWMAFYVFFALGDIIAKFFFTEASQRFLKSPLTLLILTPLFILVQIYYINNEVSQGIFLLIALFGCLTMFVLSFRLQHWNILLFLRVLGYHSLYIYVMHVFAAAFTRIVLTKLFGIYNPAILLFFGIAFGVTIPVVIYNLFIRENIGWFLFSFRKRKPQRTAPVQDIAAPALAS